MAAPSLIHPRPVSPGATLGIIAPASTPPNPSAVELAASRLVGLGFKIKFAPNVGKRNGFLAGTDRERTSDLMRMFTAKRVDAILCVRGGYGTARLLPLLDYSAIRKNAKAFVGFSDITSLQCAFLTQAKIVSYHGPMLVGDFAKPDMPEFTLTSFLETLAGKRKLLNFGHTGRTAKTIRGGVARGQLIGGNLSVLCTVIGTPYQPRFKGRILFLEDIDEAPYRFDRMLTHLSNAGLLQQVSGVAIGINENCEDPKAKTAKEYRQSLEDVLRERLLPLKVPVVIGLPFGHVQINGTLPVGADVMLDADRGELSW
jgi:muramoyltetrapeptide carboxypeptidase